MNGTTETMRDPRETAPLEDMTRAQLVAFADEVGIDLAGVKRTKAEVLHAIIAAPRPAGGAATNEATGETTPAGEPLPEAEQAALDATTEASVELVEQLAASADDRPDTDPAGVPAVDQLEGDDEPLAPLAALYARADLDPEHVKFVRVLEHSAAIGYHDQHGQLVGVMVAITEQQRDELLGAPVRDDEGA